MKVNFFAELRGIEQKVSSKTGVQYHVYKLEDADTSEPFQIICKDLTKCKGLEKGDIICVTASLVVGKYTRFEILNISTLEDKEK